MSLTQSISKAVAGVPLLGKLASGSKSGPSLTVVVRSGQLRLLMAEGGEVSWHRMIPLNPAYLEGGMIAQPRAVAASFRAGLEQSPLPSVASGVAAVAGYHALSSVLDVPTSREFKAEEIIPREARRLFSYRPDSSSLSWWPISTSKGVAKRYLFVVTRRAALQSLRELFAMAGVQLLAVDSGPLATARAANIEEGVVVQAEADGGDVIVIKGGTVGLVRSAFWGGDIVDQDSLLSRMNDLVERAVSSHNEANPMGPLSAQAPLLLSGAGSELLGSHLAESVGRPEGGFAPPLMVPDEFPVNELAANLGMVLRSIR